MFLLYFKNESGFSFIIEVKVDQFEPVLLVIQFVLDAHPDIQHQPLPTLLGQDPLPDPDGGLPLHHGAVPGPPLEHVDELQHDAVPVCVLLQVHAAVHHVLSGGDKLQAEGGRGELKAFLGDHLLTS